MAKKLNERIRDLESELSLTRNKFNVAELEKKVAVSGQETFQLACCTALTHSLHLSLLEKKVAESVRDHA